MDILLKDIIKNTPIEMDLQPSFLLNSGKSLYFAINLQEPRTNGGRGMSCYICSFDLTQHSISWVVELKTEEHFNSIFTSPVRINNTLYASSSNEILAINSSNGEILWSKKPKFKYSSGGRLSSVSERLFLSNGGELIELETSSGKVKQSIKPRVKWFDSPVISHKRKLYVSTSNSKILELDYESLTVLGEFKYSGGWAVGATPLFHNDRLVCAGYGGNITIFDIESRLAIKKFKKKAGRKPNQLLINNYFIIFESLENNILTCFDLLKDKKCWKLELKGIQKIWKKDDDTIFILYENDSGYIVDVLNIRTGKLETTIDNSPKVDETHYEFGLWDGSGGLYTESRELFLNYKPGMISVHSA
ncbi:PQQ-binding-like beta-propeller repeat protein [Colwellia sp. RE-S-Sl-9]